MEQRTVIRPLRILALTTLASASISTSISANITAHAQETEPQAAPPADRMICEKNGDVRTLEAITPGEVGKACDLRYTRGGTLSVPYHANAQAGFCASKVTALAQTLRDSGFSCARADETVAALEQPASTGRALRNDRPAGVPDRADGVQKTGFSRDPDPADAHDQNEDGQEDQTGTDGGEPELRSHLHLDDQGTDSAPADERTAQRGEPIRLTALQPAQAETTPASDRAVAPGERATASSAVGRLTGALPNALSNAPSNALPNALAGPSRTDSPVNTANDTNTDQNTDTAKTAPTAAIRLAALLAPEVPADNQKAASGYAPAGSDALAATSQSALAATAIASQSEGAEAPSAEAPRPDPKSLKPEVIITGVLTAQAAAWNEGDLKAFMGAYWKSRDLRFVSGQTVSEGWENVFKRYRRRYGDDTELGHLSFDGLDIRLVDDQLAIVIGRFRLERDGEVSSGTFSLTMKQFMGLWRIVHDHTVADAPPADDAANPGVRD